MAQLDKSGAIDSKADPGTAGDPVIDYQQVHRADDRRETDQPVGG